MRIVKILLGVVAAFVALLAVAIAIFASTFDANDYKDVATRTFTERTGRSLTIKEDLRLAYFPWRAVETGGVAVGSAPEFGGAAQPFATARRIAARVKLMPLFSRRIEIGTVELEGLTLNLARDGEGRGNWEDLLRTESAAAPAAEPAAGAPAVDTLEIEGIRIRNGNVYWRENVDELRYSVTGLTLTTGGIGRGEPISFDAALDVADEASGTRAALAVTATVAATGDRLTATDVEARASVASGGAPVRELELTAASVAFDRAAETLAVDGLATEVAGIRAEWSVTGATLLSNPAVGGAVTVERAPLAAVFEALHLALPASLEPEELGSFSLATRFEFRAEPRRIEVTGVDAELLGMRLRGDASLAAGNELAGRVAVAEFAPGPALLALLRSAVPPTVDVGALGTLALETRFDTNLDTGRAALRDLTLKAFGATISGNLEGVPGERGAVYRGTLATSRFAPDALATAFPAMLPPNLSPGELGTIELAATFVLDAAADTLTVAPLRAEAFGLRASGELAARDLSRAASSWTGRASVAQFSPQELIVRFGLPPQPTSDPQAFRRATLDTRFAATKDGVELDDLVLGLDETTIRGSFALQNFASPAYRFALRVDRVDADRYLPPKARDADPGEATAGDIELPQNNTMNLDGTMETGSLKLANLEFADVGARIVIGGGNLRLENARANLYGGTFAGSFAVQAAGDDPGLALVGRATGLGLEPLIAALTGEEPNFSGTGVFDLELAGKGRTVIENVRTARGKVSFDMTNGAIKGFNLGRTLCRLYNATQGAPAPPEQPELTSYESIRGSAVVTNGTAASNDLFARTSFMDLNGAGTLELVEQRLDYAFDAKLTASIGIRNCETLDPFIGGELPFRIRGTVTEPEITPDFSKLVRRQVREELRERVRESLEDRLRDLLR
jgi:AsmA protein